MKKRTAWIGIIAGLIILIQFWPVDRSNPPVSSEIQAPPDVMRVLRAACYNCHSNETQWPWYSRVAPVSWMVAGDVHEARGDMNFSEWDTIPAQDRLTMVRHIWKMVEKGAMPLAMYRLMHPEARLSEAQKTLIRNWSESGAQ
jgi:hypothetical protein